MSGPVDSARLLLRALRRSAAGLGCAPLLTHESETLWASATFVGARHRIRAKGDALDGWLTVLSEADLPVRDHLVASIAVERDETGALLIVLLLEA